MTETVHTCRYCGVESDWAGGFVDASNVRKGPGIACITCQLYRDMFPSFYLRIAIGATVLLVIGLNVTGTVTGAIVFAALAFFTCYAAIAIHELAHALAAAAVRVKVPVFSIGGGRRLKVLRAAGRWVILGLLPSEGLTIVSHQTSRWFRTKSGIISAAGPLANLACAAIAGAWFNQVEDSLYSYTEMAAHLFIIFSIMMGAMNLLPFRITTPYGQIDSDGLSIFKVFSLTDEDVEKAVGLTPFVVAYFEYLYGDRSRAVEMVEPVIESGDADVAMQILASAAYAETGEFDKGVAVCRSALEVDDLDRGQYAALLNNLAYILDLRNTPESLEEADAISEKAFELAPMSLSIRSTRASILVAVGREEEALALTRDKRFRIEPKAHQAHVLCTQASAYSRLGKADQATASIEKAVRLAPDDHIVAETQAALART